MSVLHLMNETPDRIKTVLDRRMQQTPDLMELRQTKDRVPVFVYGTLKEGYSNHDFFLKESDYLGQARTLKPKYKMFSAAAGAYPAVYSDEQGFYVYGEVYSVDLDTLMDLDELESNGYLYFREKHQITLLDQKVGEGKGHNPIIHSYMYIGNPKVLDHRICDNQKLKILDGKPAGYFWENRKYS